MLNNHVKINCTLTWLTWLNLSCQYYNMYMYNNYLLPQYTWQNSNSLTMTKPYTAFTFVMHIYMHIKYILNIFIHAKYTVVPPFLLQKGQTA